MTSTQTLPRSYRAIHHIDLRSDKRLSLFLNLGALLIAVGLVLLGIAIRPLPLHDPAALITKHPLQLGTAVVGAIAYIFLHELVHGIMIRLFAHVRPDYGLTGLYAYAGSRKAYFARLPYLVIALAPVVFWGLVLLLLNLVLPGDWFWPVYFIQITNLSGAVGDLYVTRLILFVVPKDTLVMDTGVEMTFYSAR